MGVQLSARLAEASCDMNPGPWETSREPKVWSLSQDGGLLQVVFTESLASFNPPYPASLLGTAWADAWELKALAVFASANLKNALVFPFGLGSPQQLPFMVIGCRRPWEPEGRVLACPLAGWLLF